MIFLDKMNKKDKQLLLRLGVPIAIAAVVGVTTYMLLSHSARSGKSEMKVKEKKSPLQKPSVASSDVAPLADKADVLLKNEDSISLTEVPAVPKNRRYLFVVFISVLLAALIALIVYLWDAQPTNTGLETAKIERRIQPVDYVVLDMSSAATEGAAEESPADIVQTKCSACHMTGAGGAPKLKNATEWSPRIRTGLEALVHSVIEGKGAMPPKGGFASLTEEQIRQAVIIMANEAGAGF